ncbi:MAG: type II secretion system F family protein [Candidatus Dojkabacteria bacterium]
MKDFNYEARTKEGAIYKGKIKAKDVNDAVSMLQSKDLIVINAQEDTGFSVERLNQINIGGVPMKDRVVFMRHLATMISAGLPISQALDILQSQAANPKFKRVLYEVYSDVQGGLSLAKAFKKNDSVFDEITISLIEAGEESGHLMEVLQRTATELENKKKLQEKIRSAFTYPIIISVVVVVVVAILVTVLVPAMKEIYDQFNSDLPWVTQFMVDVSDFILGFWWLILIIVLTGIIGIKMYIDTEEGKKNLHKLLLKMPIFGELITKIQITQFTRVLSLLLKSGLSIVESLRLTAQALSNIHFKNAIMETKEEVEKGVPMATPLARSEYFPLIVSQMVAVGEESGAIDMVLDKMSEYYNSEVEVMTSNLTTLLEPLILIVMGGVIAFVAFAVYMPMFSLVEVLG